MECSNADYSPVVDYSVVPSYVAVLVETKGVDFEDLDFLASFLRFRKPKRRQMNHTMSLDNSSHPNRPYNQLRRYIVSVCLCMRHKCIEKHTPDTFDFHWRIRAPFHPTDLSNEQCHHIYRSLEYIVRCYTEIPFAYNSMFDVSLMTKLKM